MTQAFRGWTWEPATILKHDGDRVRVQYGDGETRWIHATFVRDAA